MHHRLRARNGIASGGAALLFTANLSAILVFTVLSFLILGYNQVDADELEEGFITNEGERANALAARVHRTLGEVFGSRYGLAMRLAVPSIVFIAVFVPLRRALDEVTWEVGTRDAIRHIVAAEAPRAVETSVTVERHTISLRLLIIGSAERAMALDSTLVRRISKSSGVTPQISVVPVADARVLAAATAQATRNAPAPTPLTMSDVSVRIGSELHAVWPASAGPLAGWHVAMSPQSAPVITVHHIGPPLGDAAVTLLSGALSSRLGSAVIITDAAISATPIVAHHDRVSVWLDSALALLATIAPADSVFACVQSPASTGKRSAVERAILSRLNASSAGQAGRVTITNSGPWRIQAKLGPCDAPAVAVSSTP